MLPFAPLHAVRRTRSWNAESAAQAPRSRSAPPSHVAFASSGSGKAGKHSARTKILIALPPCTAPSVTDSGPLASGPAGRTDHRPLPKAHRGLLAAPLTVSVGEGSQTLVAHLLGVRRGRLHLRHHAKLRRRHRRHPRRALRHLLGRGGRSQFSMRNTRLGLAVRVAHPWAGSSPPR